MSAQNFWHLEGNLVADPEAGRGTSTIARFRLAHNFYNFSTKSKDVAFFRITVLNPKRAEFVLNNFTKGSGASCIGELRMNDWIDKNGQKRSDIELIADDVQFPVKSGGSATGAGHSPAPGAMPFEEDEDPDADFSLV